MKSVRAVIRRSTPKYRTYTALVRGVALSSMVRTLYELHMPVEAKTDRIKWRLFRALKERIGV